MCREVMNKLQTTIAQGRRRQLKKPKIKEVISYGCMTLKPYPYNAEEINKKIEKINSLVNTR